MPIKLDFAHVADHATMDRDDKLIIVGIFDRIYDRMHLRPIPFPAFTLVLSLSGSVADGSDHELELRFLDANGSEAAPRQAIPVQLRSTGPGYPLRAHAIMRVPAGALRVPELGDYEFQMRVDGTVVGEIPVTVTEELPTRQA